MRSSLVLLIFGVSVSAGFWQYQAMPAPDIVTFIDAGRALWHLRLPNEFQRGPVLGLIVYPLSLFVGSPVTACLLLNSVFYSLNLVLLERVARIWIPRTSFLIALVCMCNPWTLEMLTRTLCETTLTFFVLLTFWLALERRSRWAWVSAMLATMTRGDAVGLLLMLLVWQGKPWWRTSVYAVLAGFPLVVWTLLSKTSTAFHYSQILDPGRILDGSGWLSCIQTVIWPIPITLPLACGLWVLVLIGATRCWPLFYFGGVYLLIHLSYPFQETRMWVPVAWSLVIMACVGWSCVHAQRPRIVVLAVAGVLGLSLLTLAPRVMQYGARDQEFKQLADWTQRNIKPNEKVATTLWELLNLQMGMDRFVPADSNQATYVCWDSRLDSAVDKNVWKVKQKAELSKPKSQPGYTYVVSFVNVRDRNKYINLFKVDGHK